MSSQLTNQAHHGFDMPQSIRDKLEDNVTEYYAAPESYEEMVSALFKLMPTPVLSLMHAVIGISTEAGELLDTGKKMFAYEQPMDEKKFENLIEELGDLEFYACALRQRLGISSEDVRAYNFCKLAKRYANFKYSNEAARARADKAGEDVQA